MPIVPDEIVEVFTKVISWPGITGDGGVAEKLATGNTSFTTVIVFVLIQPFASVKVIITFPALQIEI